MNRARTPLRIVGIVAALLGLLFALQGIGLVGGSFMTGSTTWLVIGLVVLAAGVFLLTRRRSLRR